MLLDLGDPNAEAMDAITTAPTSNAPKPPPPMRSPFVQGDRAATIGAGRLGIQLAPSHLNLPSAEAVDSHLVPSQHHLPSEDNCPGSLSPTLSHTPNPIIQKRSTTMRRSESFCKRSRREG